MIKSTAWFKSSEQLHSEKSIKGVIPIAALAEPAWACSALPFLCMMAEMWTITPPRP